MTNKDNEIMVRFLKSSFKKKIDDLLRTKYSNHSSQAETYQLLISYWLIENNKYKSKKPNQFKQLPLIQENVWSPDFSRTDDDFVDSTIHTRPPGQISIRPVEHVPE